MSLPCQTFPPPGPSVSIYVVRFRTHKDAALVEEAIPLRETALRLRPPRPADINCHIYLPLRCGTRLRFEDVMRNCICVHWGQLVVIPVDLFTMSYLLRILA